MKKYNVFKIITIAILASVVLSYFIPGTTMNYGTVEKGAITPVPFADVFTNGITSLSAFLTLFIFVLSIGAFYAVLIKTDKYDKLVNNCAVVFNKNKGLAIVATVFALGLVTMFTGELYTTLVFVPFLISVIRKLGFSKETSLATTIGAIILGNAGSLYTMYSNQMLSLTVKDNVLAKVIITLVGLVSLVAFILVFANKPASTKDLKKENDKKLIPLHIIMWTIFVLVILGFVNWNSYFGFQGFDKFLETLRKGEIAKVSVFDALLGKSMVAFGSWQIYNISMLLIFVSVLIGIIYKEGINGFFEAFAKGLKKAFPYALIVILVNIVLVNVYSSGIFYTIALALTKKTVSVLTGTVTSVIAALCYPDYGYATQFTLTAVLNTTAKDYQSLFAILFQAVYSMFLLISPTSVILLLGLRYTETRFADWIKFIFKYFFVLFVTILVTVTITVKGFNAVSIVALILLVIVYVILFYLQISKTKTTVTKKVEVKKEEKKETKKVEAKPAAKKETKKTNNKKKTNKK